MVDIKISKYVLHLTEYGISLWGDWYVAFYYTDFEGVTHPESKHGKTFEDICKWAGLTEDEIKSHCERYDYRK